MNDLILLQIEKKVKSKYGLSGDNFKPCVCILLDQSFPQGFGFSRNPVGYIIATELRKIGKPADTGFKILSLWNQKNKPSMSEREVKGIVKSAWSTNKTYGCNNPTLLNFCMDKALCPYYQRFISKNRPKASISDFYKRGWPLMLTQPEVCLYTALPEAEKENGTFPGKRLFITYNNLHRLSRVNKGLIKACLVGGRNKRGLGPWGLIKVKIGEPYFWQHQATEIKRILPIPYPQTNTGGEFT